MFISRWPIIVAITGLNAIVNAQLNTGIVEGILHDQNGHARSGTRIVFTGNPGSRASVVTNAEGEFSLALPYGEYRVASLSAGGAANGVIVDVGALQTTRLDLVIDASGALQEKHAAESRSPGIWSAASPAEPTLQGLLLNRAPGIVTEPLNFTGVSDNRAGVVSERGYSWTDTQFKLLGMDATDSYQPGRPVILPDLQAVDEIVVRSGFAQTASTGFGTEVGVFIAQPGPAWHFTLSTADTAGFLSFSNLPPPSERGMVQQADRYHWLTRDAIAAGGPIAKWADLFILGAAQWADQTVPLAAPPNHQHSRLLLGDIRGRFRASASDQVDALYSGSRINIANWGTPVGLDMLLSRTSPPLDLPGGFDTESGVDHFDFLQLGWTHRFREDSASGLLDVRYGDSTAHMSLDPPPENFGGLQPSIEWLTEVVSGAPPMSTGAVRTRQGVEGAWQPAALQIAGSRHQIIVAAGWKTSAPLNRVTIPSDINLTTINGVPSGVTEFNTPIDSRSIIRSAEIQASDRMRLTAGLSFDIGILGDLSRGSLPPQSKGLGLFAPPETYAAQPDLIAWNSLSPRVGLAWQAPGLRRLVLRGSWFRLQTPLAGRYLDFGNPASLSGNLYQWIDSNHDGRFEPGEEGTLLSRFGGAYSSISPTLQRPYANEFDLGAEFALASQSFMGFQTFRRDDRQRIAALDIGVPVSAFTPVTVHDPGPDGIAGTEDDRQITVYAQNPATLGKDQFLLTNPPDLRSYSKGVSLRAGTLWRGLMIGLAFTAEETVAPTNPGNAVFENDPGVVGTLFMDPNTTGSTNGTAAAAGRIFVDRAYVGKMQVSYRLPARWRGIELGSAVTYMDGLIFDRQLLVTGLPQGPFMVPVGANRANYVADWNLRLLREFRMSFGRIAAGADILNVTNNGSKIQESEVTGTSFNMRLPTAIQEPREIRLLLKYEF